MAPEVEEGAKTHFVPLLPAAKPLVVLERAEFLLSVLFLLLLLALLGWWGTESCYASKSHSMPHKKFILGVGSFSPWPNFSSGVSHISLTCFSLQGGIQSKETDIDTKVYLIEDFFHHLVNFEQGL